jgi:hypothetical protein
MKRQLHPRGISLLAVLVVAVVGGGVAYATIPDGKGVIHGCYKKSSGKLRVIDTDAGASCGPAEEAISWDQTGPRGQQGPPGPSGPSGAATTYHYRLGLIIPGTSVARAFCDPGEKVTGGGGFSTGPSASSAGLTQDYPISDASGVIAFGTTAVGWQVASEGFGTVQAFVICAS